MIDIQKLKQFPLAFKAFEGYIEKQYGSVLFIYNGSGIVRNEDLIDFLDNQKVFVDVLYFPEDKRFTYEVFAINEWTEDELFFDGRNETTSNGTIKAFELLENKLKTN